MSRVFYLPLEEMPARYSRMMNGALAPLVDRVLYPEGFESVEIANGEFLDVSRTIQFKAAQMGMVAEMFTKGEVHDGDCFLLADLFHPGMEAIKYMAELLNVKVRVGGFNYAGRADPTDFVQRLGQWADSSEQGYHYAADVIFVGSKFHRAQVMDKFNLSPCKVKVTGYVWDTDFVKARMARDVTRLPAQVAWPHRPCEEKGWFELCLIAESCPHLIFVVTSSGAARALPSSLPSNVVYRYGLTKEQYYQTLQASWLFLSTAKQETFGYAMHEASVCGCAILAPRRACYAEFLPVDSLYEHTAQAIDLLHSRMIRSATSQLHARWGHNAGMVVGLLKGDDL